MTNNLRMNLVLIAITLFILIAAIVPFLAFEKTQIYKDNVNNLFGGSDVILTNVDSSRFCYISNFYTCDYVLYRGVKYKFEGLDQDDAAFFQSIWVKEENKFSASPVEFGELTGRQNEKLDNYAMAFIVFVGMGSAAAVFCLFMAIMMRFFNRMSR